MRKALIGMGVPDGKIKARGFGASKPRASSGKGETVWSRNRRVELVVVRKLGAQADRRGVRSDGGGVARAGTASAMRPPPVRCSRPRPPPSHLLPPSSLEVGSPPPAETQPPAQPGNQVRTP